MPYGLKDIDIERICQLFAKNKRIESVVLYGSRAKGNYKPFSDIDITIKGNELTRHDLNILKLSIDDLLLPYQFDISLFNSLKNLELVEHINRAGVTIFKRELTY
jgi:predicted nucleotidyltransferase